MKKQPFMDYTFEKWQQLTYEQKRDIWNHYWTPYNPTIGYETKKNIVENFIETTKIKGFQFGMRSFGWEVYEIYVVLDNSKTRVPKEFAGLPVNKGLIIDKVDDNMVKVKFNYGGTLNVDLTQKIYIG